MRCSLLLMAALTLAVTAGPTKAQSTATAEAIKATPAYETLILHRAAVKAELVSTKERFTSQHRDVVQLTYKLNSLNIEIDRMLLIDRSQITKLSAVYGHLLLKKIDLRVAEYTLRRQFTSSHPDLRKKRIELEAIRNEIEELLK
jgi:hypothetical protein